VRRNRFGGLADIGYYVDMASDPKRTGETTINVVDALRGQQEQLKRLIGQKFWISNASRSTLAEIGAQLTELQRLIAQLESDIWAQLKNAP
jgi:ABC-type transporter Mla subunit MlaD